MDKYIYEKYMMPAIWAPYLINGDASGLSEEDIKQCDSATCEAGLSHCVDVSDEKDFRQYKGIGHEVSEFTFRKTNPEYTKQLIHNLQFNQVVAPLLRKK